MNRYGGIFAKTSEPGAGDGNGHTAEAAVPSVSEEDASPPVASAPAVPQPEVEEIILLESAIPIEPPTAPTRQRDDGIMYIE